MLDLAVYLVFLVATMEGLSCINFEKFLKQDKVPQFYLLYVILVMALTYLSAQLFFAITSIKLG